MQRVRFFKNLLANEFQFFDQINVFLEGKRKEKEENDEIFFYF